MNDSNHSNRSLDTRPGSGASGAPVRLELEDGVARIILTHGDANAFDLEFITALREAVRHVVDLVGDSADVGAVLLRSEGRDFSVGGDLRTFVTQGDDVGTYVKALAETAHTAVLALAGVPVPVIAEVHGAVAGGAVGLALSADLIVAARSTKLRLAYTALGLTPDCGASWFLPRMLGDQRALDLLLTNRTLTSAEAEQWGLFSRVVDDADSSRAADELAHSLASGQVRAFSQAKMLTRGRDLDELREHLDREAELIAQSAARPEARAAMEQFLNRPRAPRA